MSCVQDKSNVPVKIGICATGVNVYKDAIRLHRFLWQNIIKISYRKSTFSVKLKGGQVFVVLVFLLVIILGG